MWMVSLGLPSPVMCLTERTGAGNGFFLPYGSVVMMMEGGVKKNITSG